MLRAFHRHSRSVKDARVRMALEIIASEFAHPLHEKDVAKRVGLSASRFRSLFKQSTGQTFNHYLRAFRVARASEMMQSNPTLRIKEVATALGYAHVSALDRDFKKCSGRSPASVKKSLYERFG